jgi:hypothetical protein
VTPRTDAGKQLLGREAYNSRSFALITPEAIAAIEAEARHAALIELRAAVEGLHDNPILFGTAQNAHRNATSAVLDLIDAALGEPVTP